MHFKWAFQNHLSNVWNAFETSLKCLFETSLKRISNYWLLLRSLTMARLPDENWSPAAIRLWKLDWVNENCSTNQSLGYSYLFRYRLLPLQIWMSLPGVISRGNQATKKRFYNLFSWMYVMQIKWDPVIYLLCPKIHMQYWRDPWEVVVMTWTAYGFSFTYKQH